MGTRANYRILRSAFDSWDAMASQVAEALTILGPERVIGVSHSQEGQTAVIIVWFWDDDDGGK